MKTADQVSTDDRMVLARAYVHGQEAIDIRLKFLTMNRLRRAYGAVRLLYPALTSSGASMPLNRHYFVSVNTNKPLEFI